jgi:phage repressor protein C with HTH and peptisase S24 domain
MQADYDKRNVASRGITNSVIDDFRKPGHRTAMLSKPSLLALVDDAAKSRAEIARVLGVAPSRITELYKGERDLSFEEGRKLMERYELEGLAPRVPTTLDDPRLDGLTFVPEFDLGYSMGGGSVLGDAVPRGVVPFQKDWLRSVAGGAFAELFVARGDGDSMEPTLKDGDVVLIDTSQKDIRQQDRIWAVAWGDLGMIKRVRRMPGGTYNLMSDNAAVTPVHAADGEMFVIGRVVWIGRRI